MSIKDLALEGISLGYTFMHLGFRTTAEVVRQKSLTPIKQAAQAFIQGFCNK